MRQDGDHFLIPGFVDVHVHGGFGVDFMSSSESEIVGWLDRLAALGVEACLPTTVTATVDDVLAAVSRLPDHPIVAGFHLEGPFLSPRFPGAQPPEAFATIPEGPSAWDEVFDHPRLRLVTLAPEIPGALALTRRLRARGVTVSMGHTDATYAQALAGVEAGVTHATHAYNAMRGLHHREPGTLGAVLDDERVSAEIIYDRVHVSPPAARILARAKGPERLVAVSDGTLAVGLAPGTRLSVWGLECVVGEGDVRLPDGTLAGSTATILDVFRNLWRDLGPEVAVAACCHAPRRVTGTPYGRELRFDAELNLVG